MEQPKYPASWSMFQRFLVKQIQESMKSIGRNSGRKSAAPQSEINHALMSAIEWLLYFFCLMDRSKISNLALSITHLTIPRVPTIGFENNVKGTFSAEWIVPSGATDDTPVILYSHGGGYVVGSTLTHRTITMGLAKRGVRVLSINYRLSPKNPFPAALTDGVSAYKYLLTEMKIPPSKIVLSGDSAGGNLALAIAMFCRDQRIPMPSGIAPLTPWCDLSGNSPCTFIEDEFSADILSGGRGFTALGKLYAKVPSYMSLPYVSPIHDIPSKAAPLPPMFFTTGTVDRLAPEIFAMFLKRVDAGETCQLYIFQDQMHAFQLLSFVPSSSTALDLEVEFVKKVTAGIPIQTAVCTVMPDGQRIEELTLDNVRNMLKSLIDRGTRAVKNDEVAVKVFAPYVQAIRSKL
ncbi:hypothetical protein SmJEL517_g05819 [Synchytrium microbalum]|uniref:Alpha/beta hydrolase fold-3 domain-containing protein n=1 Tax=Synchytrium microbalum TaxID=1806994 RepID=A0A507BSQ1_9FUNG|nr:uncharacterized protein SmJEL517_g05819 [Synchytrium microbalum]TPX30682.1 hypothetical protein SmJEL517_g05819 [Synchytrium microbalum]